MNETEVEVPFLEKSKVFLAIEGERVTSPANSMAQGYKIMTVNTSSGGGITGWGMP